MEQKKTTRRTTAAAKKPILQDEGIDLVKKDIKSLKYNYEETSGPVAATYIMRKPSGIMYLLGSSTVTIYDKEKDVVREIRYCPNEPSIFTEEQSQFAKKEPIIFKEGRLFVPSSQPNLKKFLDLHPKNMANGGSLFEREDVKKKKADSLDSEFLVIDAVSMVKNKTIDELIPVAMFFHVPTNRAVSDIKYDLLRIAKSKPKEFIDSFDNPTVQTRALVMKANEYNVIALKDSGCHWFDSNSMIVSVPVGQDPVDVMTRFCLTEKGASVLEEITNQLS